MSRKSPRGSEHRRPNEPVTSPETPPRIEARHSTAYRQDDDAENAERCTPGLSSSLPQAHTRNAGYVSRHGVILRRTDDCLRVARGEGRYIINRVTLNNHDEGTL